MVAGGGQFQGAGSAFELDDVLDTAFAPCPFADDDGAFVVLEAGAEDFAGRGAEVVDENDHGESGVRSRLGGIPDFFADVASLGTDDAAFFDEHVGDASGLAEQSTGVEAKVDDQGFHAICLELSHGGSEFIGGASCEVSQSDVADFLFVIEHEVPLVVFAKDVTHDGWHLHDGSLDGDRDQVLDPGASNLERDGFPGLALHQ